MTYWERVKHTKIHLFTELVAEMVSYQYLLYLLSETTDYLYTFSLAYFYTFTRVSLASSFEEDIVSNNRLSRRRRVHSCFRYRGSHIPTNRLSVYASIG